ncbi:MAG: MarR family winged helix-turn-helix transcriptional regulator, partial [Acidimicrobiales bacterium]
ATDLACLSVLLLEGPCTAGRLAERSGLTTGAVTGVVDRLEREGWVRRGSDPNDRRRVIVEAVVDRAPEIGPLFAPMLAASREIQDRFETHDLETVIDYTTQAKQMIAAQTALLRGSAPVPSGGDPATLSVPLGSVEAGTMHLTGKLVTARLLGADLGVDLCRVRFEGPQPIIRAQDGEVHLVLPHKRWLLPGTRKGEVILNAAVPWAVAIEAGASRLDADLTPIRLTGLSVNAGASELDLLLPAPEGLVTVKIHGGACMLTLRRPAGIPVSVTARGGACDVTVDSTHLSYMGGGSKLEGLGDPDARGSYEIFVSGGATKVVVDQI